MKKAYIITAAGIIAYVAIRAYQAWKEVKYKFTNFRFAGMSTQQISLSMDFVVYNPTSVSVAVGDLDLAIMLNGQQVGFVNNLANIELQRNGITVFPLIATFDSSESVMQIVNSLGQSAVQYWTLTFVGTLKVEGHSLPIRYNVPLNDIL